MIYTVRVYCYLPLTFRPLNQFFTNDQLIFFRYLNSVHVSFWIFVHNKFLIFLTVKRWLSSTMPWSISDFYFRSSAGVPWTGRPVITRKNGISTPSWEPRLTSSFTAAWRSFSANIYPRYKSSSACFWYSALYWSFYVGRGSRGAHRGRRLNGCKRGSAPCLRKNAGWV